MQNLLTDDPQIVIVDTWQEGQIERCEDKEDAIKRLGRPFRTEQVMLQIKGSTQCPLSSLIRYIKKGCPALSDHSVANLLNKYRESFFRDPSNLNDFRFSSSTVELGISNIARFMYEEPDQK
jgi:hypothetical protein